MSCSLRPAASEAPRALARTLRWVSTTPFGSLVEPEENWMNATSSGPTAAGCPGGPTSSSWSIRKTRDSSFANAAASSTPRAKSRRRSRVFWSV